MPVAEFPETLVAVATAPADVGAFLQGRGVDGQYPNYRVVIPQDVGQFVAVVDIAAADLALVRSAIPRLTSGNNCVVRLCAVPGGVPLLVSGAVPILVTSRCGLR